ncbi:hypothetical protein P4133_35125 [Pseudomonas aeruginosa]|nr:hypothetical protein [Pseudomonas aeruginosa]
MATGKELDLALRIRADGNQGAQALDNINSQVEQIGTSATATSSQLSAIGESADQQAARLKAMVAASLQQQAAFDALANSSDKLNTLNPRRNCRLAGERTRPIGVDERLPQRRACAGSSRSRPSSEPPKPPPRPRPSSTSSSRAGQVAGSDRSGSA